MGKYIYFIYNGTPLPFRSTRLPVLQIQQECSVYSKKKKENNNKNHPILLISSHLPHQTEVSMPETLSPTKLLNCTILKQSVRAHVCM